MDLADDKSEDSSQGGLSLAEKVLSGKNTDGLEDDDEQSSSSDSKKVEFWAK